MMGIVLPWYLLLFSLSVHQEPLSISPDPSAKDVIHYSVVRSTFIELDEPAEILNEATHPDFLPGAIGDLKFQSDGTMVISDRRLHRIGLLSSDRTSLVWFGQPGQGPGDFNLRGGGRIAVNNEDQIYVADSGNMRIQWFDRDGSYLGSIRTAFSPVDIDFLADGSMVCSSHIGSSVLIQYGRGLETPVVILKRTGFTGFGIYLANGWLIESIDQRVYMYNVTSGVLVCVIPRTNSIIKEYIHGPEVLKVIRDLVGMDRPGGDALSVQQIVMGYAFCADKDNGLLYVQLLDAEAREYRSVAILDEKLQLVDGFRLPTSQLGVGIVVHGGNLYTFGSTEIRRWER